MVQVGSGQKVRTDHFQAVTPGAVASQDQGRGLDRSLNDRALALVQFEVDNLPRFGFPPASSLSTSCLNSSYGITRALCNQVAQLKCCLSLLASFHDESRLAFVEYLELRTSERKAFLRLVHIITPYIKSTPRHRAHESYVAIWEGEQPRRATRE